MKVKKMYTGAIFSGLTHEKAKCKCLLNPDYVLTRKEWVGYHFIEDLNYYILTKDGELLDMGSCMDDLTGKVYNIEDKDWIIAFRNNLGKEKEKKANNN